MMDSEYCDGVYYSTRLNLPPEVQVEILELLNQTLASSIDLWRYTEYARWALRGKHLTPLRNLLGHFSDQFNPFIALIGKRIVILGGLALGTTRIASQQSELPNYELKSEGCIGPIIVLAEQMAMYGVSIRSDIEIALGLGEMGTADLFIKISRWVDQSLWLLEAHLQA